MQKNKWLGPQVIKTLATPSPVALYNTYTVKTFSERAMKANHLYLPRISYLVTLIRVWLSVITDIRC